MATNKNFVVKNGIDAGGTVTAPSFSGPLSGNASSATNATNTINVSITNDNSTNATHYLTFVSSASGNQALDVASSKLYFNPSTGNLVVGGNVNSIGGMTMRGAFSMQSAVAGNPVILSFQDQTGTAGLELGRQDGTATTPFIDFHAGAVAIDYDVRIMALNPNGAVGGGQLIVYASQVNLPSVVVSGTLTVAGVTKLSTTTGITAAGTTQGTATALTTSLNVVTSVAAGSGVSLPSAETGMQVVVVNTSTNALNVYPASSDAIDSYGLNVAMSLPAGARLMYLATSTSQWYTLNATYA